MSDPDERLSSFDPGPSMNPLPPTEVRRQGERLRRRNTALVVGGAVAAVVLIAAPIAVFANRDDDVKPQPAVPGLDQSVLLNADEVPVRDRLTQWREAEQQGPVLACAPDASVSLDETSSQRRDFAADVAGVPAGDLPVSVVRTEVLEFTDDAAAVAAYQTAQSWIVDCPGGEDSASPGGTAEATIDLEDGQGEWSRHDFFAPDICTDCDAIRFDRMGVAQFGDRVVLVSLAEVGGPLQPEGLDGSMDELFNAVVTRAGGQITGGTSSGSGSGGPAPESLDFPLDLGLPQADGETTVEGPDPGTEGVTFPEGFCGSDDWPVADLVSRLAVKVSGPEYGLWRELVTFEFEESASAMVDQLNAAVEACPTVTGDQAANDITFVSHDVDAGHEAATFAYTYREGLGGVIYQFVAVGHAVLATAQYGEWSPGTTGPGARQLNSENKQLTALMCEYTETGC
jgi:hypothetical protein